MKIIHKRLARLVASDTLQGRRASRGITGSLAVALCMLGSIATSHAASLYSTAGSAAGGFYNTDNGPIGFQFLTTAQDFILTSVTPKFDRAGSSATIELSIYTDGGASGGVTSTVGSLVTTFYTAPITTLSGNDYEDLPVTGLSVSLSPNTSYWLIADLTNNAGDTLYWRQASSGSTPASLTGLYNARTQSGAYNYNLNGGTGAMQAEVTAVPEPSTVAMALVGGVVAVVTMRRRRKTTA